MAPEQILASKEVGPSADLYALAVVAYQLLTGSIPFEGTLAHILYAHLNQPAPDPRLLRAEIPDFASRAILKALAKDPAARFPSVTAFSEAFSAA
jgi:serine/threonine protein kinase